MGSPRCRLDICSSQDFFPSPASVQIDLQMLGVSIETLRRWCDRSRERESVKEQHPLPKVELQGVKVRCVRARNPLPRILDHDKIVVHPKR